MKNTTIYITTENTDVLKRNFLNLRFFGLISVKDVINDLGISYDTDDIIEQFIINKAITTNLDDVLKNKRLYAIIYTNPWLNKETIINLHEYLEEFDNIKKIVLLDYKNNRKNESLYELFDEVAFFPDAKKIKIFDCESCIPIIKDFKIGS